MTSTTSPVRPIMKLSTVLSLNGWFLMFVGWVIYPVSFPGIVLTLAAVFLFLRAGKERKAC